MDRAIRTPSACACVKPAVFRSWWLLGGLLDVNRADSGLDLDLCGDLEDFGERCLCVVEFVDLWSDCPRLLQNGGRSPDLEALVKRAREASLPTSLPLTPLAPLARAAAPGMGTL